jgi:hypothetical protein
LGWVAVGYPGWAEIPGFTRYVDLATWEVNDTGREGLDRTIVLNNILQNIKFFRLMSMCTYVGGIIPPILKHFFQS